MPKLAPVHLCVFHNSSFDKQTSGIRSFLIGAQRSVSTPAMATRKLGGGRILGSGRSLAPPAAPAHQRDSSPLSFTESTVSGSSEHSTPLTTSPLPDNVQDLSSRVSLDHGGSAVTASPKLVCPICNEEMVCSSITS